MLIQVEGLALDGRKRIVEFIRSAGGAWTAQNAPLWLLGKPDRVSSPALPVAIGLYDDHRVFLARAMSGNGTEADHVEALEHLSHFNFSNKRRIRSGDVLSSPNPPWLQMALQAIPANSCGLCLGEIPTEMRKYLTVGKISPTKATSTMPATPPKPPPTKT